MLDRSVSVLSVLSLPVVCCRFCWALSPVFLDFTTSWHRHQGAPVALRWCYMLRSMQCSPAKSFAKLSQHLGDLAVPQRGWRRVESSCFRCAQRGFYQSMKNLKIIRMPQNAYASPLRHLVSHLCICHTRHMLRLCPLHRGPSRRSRGLLSSCLQPQRAPQRTGPRCRPLELCPLCHSGATAVTKFHRRSKRHVCFVALKTQKADRCRKNIWNPGAIFAIIGGVSAVSFLQPFS